MCICIPIKTGNVAELKKQIKMAVSAKPDFIEIWLDNFNLADFRALFKECKTPVIAVCREGKNRIEMLKRAILAGAEYIDVDIRTEPRFIFELKKLCNQKNTTLIISQHFWNSTPPLERLLAAYRSAKRFGADIVKIATYVKRWSDNAILFELTSRAVKNGDKIIVIGIGEKGRISRIGCPMLGSFLTYVALDEKSKTAEGQLTMKEKHNFAF